MVGVHHRILAIREMLPASLIQILRRIRGAFTKTILSFPDAPEPGSVFFKICENLGYRMTQDITARADVIINWEDCSFRRTYPAAGSSKSSATGAEPSLQGHF